MALAGCGGGGSGDDSYNDLEGQWEGPLYLYPINGYNGYNDYRLIVLEDGSLWGTMSSNNYTASTNIQSMLHGSGESYYDGTCYSYYSPDDSCYYDPTEYFKTSYTQFNFGGPANSQLGLSGSIDGSTLDGKFSYGTRFKLSSGNYVQAVSLPSIAGVYSGDVAISGSNSRYSLSRITISGSTLTLPADANGCSASGALKPHLKTRPSNGSVTVFDTSLTFNGAGCILGNGTTVRGVAYQATFDNTPAIQVLAVTPDNQIGFMMTGIRQ